MKERNNGTPCPKSNKPADCTTKNCPSKSKKISDLALLVLAKRAITVTVALKSKMQLYFQEIASMRKTANGHLRKYHVVLCRLTRGSRGGYGLLLFGRGGRRQPRRRPRRLTSLRQPRRRPRRLTSRRRPGSAARAASCSAGSPAPASPPASRAPAPPGAGRRRARW